MRRPAALAIAALLQAVACTPSESPSCPGAPVATFHFKGPMVLAGDLLVAALDPVPGIADCTPDPTDRDAPIRYPHLLPPFDATLANEPGTGAAALCRTNGIVLVGERTASRYSVEADSDAATLSSTCVATLRVLVIGDLVADGGGNPAGFQGLLVEVLTAARGNCDAALPVVAGSTPPTRACAGRYLLTGAPP